MRTKIESSAADRTVLSGTGPDWSKARINACSAVSALPDTTAPTVIAPSNLTATLGGKVSRPQISGKWADNSTNETNFTVERPVDNGSSWNVLSSSLAANTIIYTDKTVQSGGKTYTYRVKATKGTESSAYSNTASATTK